MKVSMLLQGEKFSLCDQLAERGVEARVVGGQKTVVYLPAIRGCVATFRVIPEVVDGRFQLEVSESGGANGSRNATVVCGFGGKPLLPYYVARNGNAEPCGEIAKFVLPEGVVTIKVDQRQLTIQRHDLLVDRDAAHGQPIAVSILSEKIWEGEARATVWKCASCGEHFQGRTYDVHHAKGQSGWLCWGELEVVGINLPTDLDRFQDAAITAVEKSRCVGCTHAHFARERLVVTLPLSVVPVQSPVLPPTEEERTQALSQARSRETLARLAAEDAEENKARQAARANSCRKIANGYVTKKTKAGSRR